MSPGSAGDGLNPGGAARRAWRVAGLEPSLAIVDELHVVTRQVSDAVSLAAGKRDRSLTLAISTPGVAREGVMWDLVEHGRRGDDPSFVYVEYAAPEGCEVDDEDAWAVANPALGDFLYLDAFRSTMRTTREADFRRYRFGQWTQHADAWLPREAWLACAEVRPIPDDADVVLGFDGSYSGDATARCGSSPSCTATIRRGPAVGAPRCAGADRRRRGRPARTRANGGGCAPSSPTRSGGHGACSSSLTRACRSRSSRRARSA
jgi:Phage Terminase